MIVLFYLFSFTIYTLSLFPLSLLYLLANCISFLLYRIIRYRRDLVIKNLQNAFPYKSKQEIESIAKAFYANLADIIVEGIKSWRMTDKDFIKRVAFENPEIVNDLYEKGYNLIGATAHFCNWEWLIRRVPLDMKHKVMTIYQPIKSTYFDVFFKKYREKSKSLFISTKAVNTFYESLFKTDLFASGFLIDQSPSNNKKVYWVHFLNQPTAMLYGVEYYARKYKQAVVYFQLNRIKRGYYRVKLIPLFEEVTALPKGQIVKAVAHTLEQQIIDYPQGWLWSHNRWKHKHTKETP